MMKMDSKMRQASSARNSTATMMAAFMLGMVTFHRRCMNVSPSTLAASCSTSGTCDRPASSNSEMNGVVFQISSRQITTRAEERWPNQLYLWPTAQPSQLLTKPESSANAYFQANAETTVMIPYGSRIAVRTVRRPKMILFITMANTKPITSSNATVTTVMITVVTTSCHHNESFNTTP